MQVRGKKNLVIGQDLAGPVGLFVKFSQLQEYGVDRVFLLENANVDSTQRNVVFLVHGENMRHVRTVAGMWCPIFLLQLLFLFVAHCFTVQRRKKEDVLGTTVDYADSCPTLRNQSEFPILISFGGRELVSPFQLFLFKAFFACPIG